MKQVTSSARTEVAVRRPRPVASKSFPTVVPGLAAEARYLPAQPQIVIKKVAARDLVNVLWIFATFITLAFAIGAVLWVLT